MRKEDRVPPPPPKIFRAFSPGRKEQHHSRSICLMVTAIQYSGGEKRKARSGNVVAPWHPDPRAAFLP